MIYHTKCLSLLILGTVTSETCRKFINENSETITSIFRVENGLQLQMGEQIDFEELKVGPWFVNEKSRKKMTCFFDSFAHLGWVWKVRLWIWKSTLRARRQLWKIIRHWDHEYERQCTQIRQHCSPNFKPERGKYNRGWLNKGSIPKIPLEAWHFNENSTELLVGLKSIYIFAITDLELFSFNLSGISLAQRSIGGP